MILAVPGRTWLHSPAGIWLAERGKAFRVLKDHLKESEKNCDIRIRAVTLGLESMRQHRKGEFLSQLECGRWLLGMGGVREYRQYLNGGGTLGMDNLQVTALPALVAVDLHTIIRLSLSRHFRLAHGCHGGGFEIYWPESAGTSQHALGPTVLKEGTDVDCSHHGPFSFFRSFYAETFKKLGESGGKIIELDVGKKHAVEKDKKLRHASIRS